jgi:hypothetical protein
VKFSKVIIQTRIELWMYMMREIIHFLFTKNLPKIIHKKILIDFPKNKKSITFSGA